MESRNETNALVVFLMGLGILAMVLGPCTGLYGIGLGFIGLVASWVVAITLRVYHTGRPEDNDYWAYS
jgi:uncharacterized oligopeptide transporter (OPT) family protein